MDFDSRVAFRDPHLWCHEGTTRARGLGFEGQRLLDSRELARRFDQLGDDQAFLRALEGLNGFFSIVQLRPDTCRIAVDHVRSIPLFYSLERATLRVSDDCCWIEQDLGKAERAPWADLEFLCLGYVTGHDTRNPKIRQCLPGEAVFFAKDVAPRGVRYFRYQHEVTPPSSTDFVQSFQQLLDGVFQRLLRVAGGRTIVVPLSGGFDSRLIALMLRRLGYEHLLSFSYGHPANRESRVSRSVAHDAGIPWTFVPYSNEQWARWYHCEERRRWECYAGRLASLACYQDWPAVGVLIGKEVVPPGSVFVPGHSADMLAGSRSTVFPELYASGPLRPDRLADSIRRYHYALWEASNDPQWPTLMERLHRQVHEIESAGAPSEASAFESWDWENRQAKFIVNSIRVYEYYRQSWWLPFWDREFVRFWARAPRQLRFGKQWYDAFVEDLYRRTLRVAGPRKSRLKRLCAPLRRLGLVRTMRQAFKRKPRARNEYDNHPMQWYGIISAEQFLDLYRPGQNINSFLCADLLKRVSIQPPAGAENSSQGPPSAHPLVRQIMKAHRAQRGQGR